MLSTAHSDTPDLRPHPALDGLRPPVSALGCRFVTTDLAQRTAGTWCVIEVGDGQVSDLPATTDPTTLMTLLLTV